MEILLSEAMVLAAVMAPVIAIFVQLIKAADINKRWLPFISIAIGVGVGIAFAIAGGADLFLYGLAGLLSGAGASGLYDSVEAIRKDDK